MKEPSRTVRVLRPVLNALLPAEVMPVTVLSGPARGLRLLIEPHRERSYWLGTHERPVQAALLDVLRPGMTVWDVGAHAGFYTAVCSRLVGPYGAVHAFEPAPETRARLDEMVRLNDLRNVSVHAFAVGAERGEGLLYGVGRSAQATLRPLRRGSATTSPVAVRALPDLWEELGPPDVIKIDAEGAEAGIVEGGAAVLVSSAATLVVETHDDHAATRIARLLPGHSCDRLDGSHWSLRPGGRTATST